MWAKKTMSFKVAQYFGHVLKYLQIEEYLKIIVY